MATRDFLCSVSLDRLCLKACFRKLAGAEASWPRVPCAVLYLNLAPPFSARSHRERGGLLSCREYKDSLESMCQLFVCVATRRTDKKQKNKKKKRQRERERERQRRCNVSAVLWKGFAHVHYYVKFL